VDSVANACGTCHAKNAKLFADTRMKHQFAEVGLPGCAVCHGNHQIRHPTDEMLGMGDNAKCAECHAHGKYGATLAGAEAARSLRNQLDELDQLVKSAQDKVGEAERLGMEVSGPRFDLRKTFDAQVNARALIHTFDPKSVQQSLAEGKQTASDVKERAEAALQEYTARRIWLGASLVPLAAVVLLLFACIRRLPIPPSQGQ
jgi:hypothetical protein